MQEANTSTQAIVTPQAADAIIRAEKIEKYYAQPRDRKSEAFTQRMDYIYKVLTRPDTEPAGLAAALPPFFRWSRRFPHNQFRAHFDYGRELLLGVGDSLK